jgi:hypothetical protein
MAATAAPLTLERAWRNFTGAFGRTKLRIPLDPQEAYREFCGSGTPTEVAALAPQQPGEGPAVAVRP